jgi:predicted RNA binding protein YcfA (HicA-like mRNA interferase family)
VKIVPIHYKKLIKILELDGATIVGQKGSHVILTKPGAKRRLVVPTYLHVPVFIIKNNLKTAGISRERYFELLKKTG